jgi:uncharacterized protein (DUF58 family)
VPTAPTSALETDAITELLKKVRRIELITRGIVRSKAGGEYHSVFKGQGIDFDDFREYQPGDEVRFIDWHVTARQGTPFIRKYVEERELTIYLAVDISASSAFGSTDKTKRDLMAEIGAIFALSAVYNQDKVGLVLFTDEVELFLPPAKSRIHCLRIIREILGRPAQGRGTDFKKALDLITRHTSRRCLVLCLSDFQSPGLSQSMKVAAVRHDLVAVQVSDPAEIQLPDAGRLRLIDPETGGERIVNTGSANLRATYKARRDQWQAVLDQTFKTLSIDKIAANTDTLNSPYQAALHGFFQRRAKRR